MSAPYIRALLYDKATGAIIGTVEANDQSVIDAQVSQSVGAIAGEGSSADFYIDATPAIVPRVNATGVTLSATDVARGETATLSGLPDPCWLLVNGTAVRVTGRSCFFAGTARMIGKYKGPTWVVAVHDLAALKADVTGRIDAAAEASRLKYITGGSGQALVYQQKAEEARAYAAATAPVDANYPLLDAEATATGVTVAALAQIVTTVTGQWIALAARIEGLRMAAKKAASEAATIEAVLAAEQVNWP